MAVYDGFCEACENPIKPGQKQKHHKFSNTKPNRKYYGKKNHYDGIDWLNKPDNIQKTCAPCNVSHAGQGRGLVVWNELEFCKYYKLIPRSKSMQFKNFGD